MTHPTTRPIDARRRIATIAAALVGAPALLLGATPAFAADAFFPPVAADDAYGMVQGQTLIVAAVDGVLANDSYSDAGPIVVDGVWASGTLTVHPDGGFTFTPDPSFTGDYTFQYTVLDTTSNLGSGMATVTITVSAKPPIANPDDYAMVQGGTFHIDAPGVLANDISGSGGPLVVAAVDGLNSAEVVLNTAGWLTYTPDPAFVGTMTFQYRVDDGTQSSEWTTVTIVVSPAATTDNGDDDPQTGTGRPQLAETGGDASALLGGAAFLAMLGTALAVIAARRRLPAR